MPPATTKKPAELPPGNIRVNYAAGRKISHPHKQYESYDFHVSISTDLLPGETPSDAFGRCEAFVERELKAKGRQVRRGELEY